MKSVVFCFFLCVFVCFSQDREEQDEITYLLKNKPENYFTIDSIFRKKKKNLEEIQELLKKSQEQSYEIGEIFAYNLLGRHYRNTSSFKKSITYHNTALKKAQEIGYVEGQIVSLNYMGVTYRRHDDIRNAINRHQEALSIARRIRNPSIHIKTSISIAENSIGNIYLQLKQYDLALNQFKTAIKIQKETNNLRGLAINYQNIGNAQEESGRLEEALENYKKSLKYNLLGNDEKGKIICTNSISGILIKQGKYQEAYKLLEPILPLAIKGGNDYYISKSYNSLGWAQLHVNKLKEADKSLQEGLRIAIQNDYKSNQLKSYEYISVLKERTKNYKEALTYFKKFKEGETYNEKNVLYVNDLIIKYENEMKSSQIRNLAKQNEITKLKLTRNRNILITTLVTLALLSVVLYSVYRQRLLNNEKKILMLEHEALQSQMNPHFIFNALNSIKLYIINNEQKNAVYYLNKFSKLIRNILEASKIKEVSLKEELKTMALYMSIENIRLSNEVTYREKISDGLNIDIIKVPPLILQPFLENAIWHGLQSKKGKKEVVLSIEKTSNNYIKIDIVDNGIGRDAALKRKAGKSLNRRSIGIDLTKERLQNFASEYKNNYSLEYFDLKDNVGSPMGTKVSLKIPLN